MLRTLFYAVTFVPWTLLVILTGLPFSYVHKNFLHSYATFWAKVSLRLAGVRLVVEGRENLPAEGAVVFMPNHQSNFDILALFAALSRQFRWLAKEELFHIPLFGLTMRRAGYIPVDRSNRKKSVESMRHAIERISDGTSVVIFPEGTRSPDGHLKEFKAGSFTLAIQAQVPIVPIAITGSRDVMPKHSRWIRGGRVTVTIMPPVSTADRAVKERNELMQEVRGPIEALVEKALQS
ncbi:[acyl-]glycerolphosphate acyltransferase [Syntrophotalea carbinolica DSM 2380]|uniref:1-acyl-sn-glycerol-3-phosphate acyltransferase n=1 Tax=Syntrophotalea carbinolica (strain DSM 2380 / NBRC 103641 / GraBd1) TaxID=338963 RepID=Q3A6V4_SYNC1|nr:lysophospholipid acyltransferase family protein [Syntrophotalea carbinolica]ABA87903.1 [acyl-]glycerolphosphate acyltransferase [Syntrophotalea carbinolica DSM 2380]